MLQATDEEEPPQHALPPPLRQATPAPLTRAPRFPADQLHETKQMLTAAAEQAQQTADLWKLDESVRKALQIKTRAEEAGNHLLWQDAEAQIQRLKVMQDVMHKVPRQKAPESPDCM